ncbi:unnamed protein product [Ectocarpus fasciculatus]
MNLAIRACTWTTSPGIRRHRPSAEAHCRSGSGSGRQAGISSVCGDGMVAAQRSSGEDEGGTRAGALAGALAVLKSSRSTRAIRAWRMHSSRTMLLLAKLVLRFRLL